MSEFAAFYLLWVLAGAFLVWFVFSGQAPDQVRFRLNVEALHRWYQGEQLRCFQCNQPIWGGDDALVCSKCGGRNKRVEQ